MNDNKRKLLLAQTIKDFSSKSYLTDFGTRIACYSRASINGLDYYKDGKWLYGEVRKELDHLFE